MTLLSTPPLQSVGVVDFFASRRCVVVQAVAEFPTLYSPLARHKASAPAWRRLALPVSLCLHAGLVLLLVWAVPHQQGAPLPKRALTVIALQSLLQAAPAPSVASPYVPPAPPHRRPHPAATKLAAAAPVWQTPPAPTPQPPPSPPQTAMAPAAAPAPDPAPATVAAVDTSAAAPAAGSAARNDALPLAYLSEVSQMIRVNLNPPREARWHAMSVAVVHIRIARDGTVLGAGVIQSTGYQVLDEEALAVVLRIHKFPEPPGEYFPFNIDQPIRFFS